MQDISLFCVGQKVDRSPKSQGFAEIKAADLVPYTLGRRLCISSRYVGAVLTASFSPAAPIQSIETEVLALGNTGAVPRGPRSFRLQADAARLSLLPAHTGKIWDLPGIANQLPGEKKKAELCHEIAE